MVSRLCSRRVRLLLVAVTGSRLWLLDGCSQLRFSSDLSLSAACLVLRVESGYFLIEAASLRFIVCPLR